jgi:LysR family glycine cleavage system transcriptional activator
MTPSMSALRCFDAAARLLSFTRAAGEVHLTQSAVSQQVAGLEAQLGTPLFVRHRGGLQLSAAGRAYWIETSSALRQIERATQDLITHKGQGGPFDLSVASSFASYWLVPRLSGFVAAHPDVTLNLSTQIGPVDFSSTSHTASIEYCDGPGEGLTAVRVHALKLEPYAATVLLKGSASVARKLPPKRAELLRLLRKQPLIRHATVPEAWPCWLQAAGLAKGLEDQLRAGPQYDLLSMALNGVIGGLGIALLPEYMARGALAAGQIVKLSDVSWESQKSYFLRYPAWKSDLGVLRRFQKWLLQTANVD